jgi:hypothetical protein
LVRQLFECVFDEAFPSRAPRWLQENGRIVLDGYSESLRIAFEYHGEQHYKSVPFFRRALSEQQERDARVRMTCLANNVTLIEVSALPDGYTHFELMGRVVEVIESATGKVVSESAKQRFLAMPARTSKLKEINQIAEQKGGRCIDSKYVSGRSKLRFRCAEGHEWSAVPESIKKGHWCPYCSNCRIVAPLEKLVGIAASRGGACLSSEYAGSKQKMHFQCQHRHEWHATAASIRAGRWCPYCSRAKISDPLGEIREVAAGRGGICLSTEYVRSSSKLIFQCHAKHTFETKPADTLRGQWCPVCKVDNHRVRMAERRRAKEMACELSPQAGG